jgi:hypothetical protein
LSGGVPDLDFDLAPVRVVGLRVIQGTDRVLLRDVKAVADEPVDYPSE